MSNNTSIKRAHPENQNISMSGRKRMKRSLYAEEGCSTKIRARQLSFDALPEDIMSRIMSDLTLKEAVRTSVVASKWRWYWKCHPNLKLDISTVLGSKAKRNQSTDRYKRMLGIKRYIDRVNYILRKHSGLPVNKLVLKFELRKEHATHIDGWVSFAIASRARIFTLNFSPYLGSYENNYSFPCHLFNNKNVTCLQALRLDSVNIGPSPGFCGFLNLKMLALDHVLALQNLQYFLSKCPVLEWLSIRWCYEKCNLHASEPFCRLKYLCVQDCAVNNINVVAPNLNTFDYRGPQILMKFHDCSKLKKASFELRVQKTLEHAFTGIPNLLPHVETLRVEAFVMSEIPGFSHAPLIFSHLRRLALKLQVEGKTSVFQLACLLEAAPLLKDLRLDMHCFNERPDPIDGELIADCRHYHLKTASISGFCGEGGQVELVKYIMRNATRLERFTVDPKNRINSSSGFMSEDFGRTSAHYKLVPLDKTGVLRVL